ncbi:MAG: OmpA family protein [Myxococcales bacterium]|nr:OmpA family protein [Myxococcales bacterium]
MEQWTRMGTQLAIGGLLAAMAACSAPKVVPPPPPPKPKGPPPGMIELVKYEKKTQQLLNATVALGKVRQNADETRRRLAAVCVDHPDHRACAAETAAKYAREAFCKDQSFVGHIDKIVKACHQGQCKQVDEANLITRSQYMTLVSHLPHSLVTFRARGSKLDRRDKKQLQHFIENIGAEKGYVIIVGRASKDGPWKKNLEYALNRAEATRKYLVEDLGLSAKRVGYITYGHAKMYLTALDTERLTERKMSVKQANRSALVFAYPCFSGTK